MPVSYNPYGGLTARDIWDVLEGYYPVVVNGAIAGGGATILLNIGPGIRGCIESVGTTSAVCSIIVTLDGVAYNLTGGGAVPANLFIPITGAFSTTAIVQFINGAGAARGWITYRRL